MSREDGSPERSGHVDTFAADNLPPRELWPAMPVTEARFRTPARLNCVSALLDARLAAGDGERPCMLAPGESLTYAAFAARVNRIANVLVGRLGLRTGNRVLLRSANTPTMAAAYLAVLKAGGIVVATMPLLRAGEIAFPARKAEVTLALCDGTLSAEMERARPLVPTLRQVVYWGDGATGSLESLEAAASAEFAAADTAADDIALIAFTSGTTGEPKGTMHAHKDMLAIVEGFAAEIVGATRDDRFVGSAPFAFTFGLAMLLFPLRVGASAVLLAKAGPNEIGEAVGRFGATVCFTAPTAYRAMLARPAEYDLRTLRRCISSGEPLDRATFERWRDATGLPLINVLGATEMLHAFVAAAVEPIRPGSLGRPVRGFVVRGVDEAGHPVPPGTLGRLAVRGPLGCRYLADARQTSYVQDGWNMPGDAVRQDPDGTLWYAARADDMIVSAGYNIAGPEVEAALLSHPAVAECGVVGAPDPERGTIVKAYVLPAPGVEPSPALARALQEHVKATIAPYKYPRAVAFVTALPKTASGKLQRFALRAMA